MGQTDSIPAQGAIYAKGLIPQRFSFTINSYLITPAVGMASKGREQGKYFCRGVTRTHDPFGQTRGN